MELDAHALEAFHDDHTIGQPPKGTIELGDDYVVAWAELGEEGAAALSLFPGDFARLRRIYEASHNAELMKGGVILDLAPLNLGRVHLLSGGSPAISQDTGHRVIRHARSSPFLWPIEPGLEQS